MKFFLRMKAWQIFLLIFGFPFVSQFLLAGVSLGAGADTELMFTVMPIIMSVFMALFLSWFWVLGTALNSYVSVEIRPGSGFFKFGVIYSALYMLLFEAFFFSLRNNSPGEFMGIIFPLHIFAMFCMFYSIYFIAKNLMMAEKNERVRFYDFSGPFFLIWFFPIGLWFVQPRINELYARHS